MAYKDKETLIRLLTLSNLSLWKKSKPKTAIITQKVEGICLLIARSKTQ